MATTGRTVIGLDLASTTDLCAAAETTLTEDALHLRCRFWCPALRVKERELGNRQRFAEWVKAGWIKQTPTDYTDYDTIHDDLLADIERTNAVEVAVDAWNFTQLAVKLKETLKSRRHRCTIVPIRTGFASISAATKEAERLILAKRVRVEPNPVLDWMFGNVVIGQDANGNQKPDREKSADKIDGIVAFILALARQMAIADVPPSKYETQGLTFMRFGA